MALLLMRWWLLLIYYFYNFFQNCGRFWYSKLLWSVTIIIFPRKKRRRKFVHKGCHYGTVQIIRLYSNMADHKNSWTTKESEVCGECARLAMRVVERQEFGMMLKACLLAGCRTPNCPASHLLFPAMDWRLPKEGIVSVCSLFSTTMLTLCGTWG